MRCTDPTGERIKFPFWDDSPNFRASGGQSIIYCTLEQPLLFTHYELLFDSEWDRRTAPLQWQLCGSNEDGKL